MQLSDEEFVKRSDEKGFGVKILIITQGKEWGYSIISTAEKSSYALNTVIRAAINTLDFIDEA